MVEIGRFSGRPLCAELGFDKSEASFEFPIGASQRCFRVMP